MLLWAEIRATMSVQVEFDSTKRKLLPIKGYRPDIVIPSLTDEYWGITFVEGEIELFDFLSLLAWLSHSMMSIISRSGKISYLL